MSETVVLMGHDETGHVVCVGLYEDANAAKEAVRFSLRAGVRWTMATHQMGRTIDLRSALDELAEIDSKLGLNP